MQGPAVLVMLLTRGEFKSEFSASRIQECYVSQVIRVCRRVLRLLTDAFCAECTRFLCRVSQ
jgi:hypothetical protein